MKYLIEYENGKKAWEVACELPIELIVGDRLRRDGMQVEVLGRCLEYEKPDWFVRLVVKDV